MKLRHFVMMGLAALASAVVGWVLRGVAGGDGGSAGLFWPDAMSRGSWQVQPVSSGTDTARKRPERTAKEAQDKPAMRMHMDGSITVPAGLTDRIRVNVMDHDGRVSRDELALFGISGEKADQLQTLADDVKATERERQTKHARVLKDDDDVTVLMIPPGNAGGTNGPDSRRDLEARLDTILGQDHALVTESLRSRFLTISNSWQEDALVVDTRRTKSGKREYRVYRYSDANGSPLPEDMLDPVTLMRSSSGVRTYYSEEIPEDLRHLFK